MGFFKNSFLTSELQFSYFKAIIVNLFLFVCWVFVGFFSHTKIKHRVKIYLAV